MCEQIISGDHVSILQQWRRVGSAQMKSGNLSLKCPLFQIQFCCIQYIKMPRLGIYTIAYTSNSYFKVPIMINTYTIHDLT